ncbi:MAG: RES family NAD+ phosphorylase [Pseudolabrys sp.]
MRLWRISNFPDLSGIGGVENSARWHSRGREIVYLAESPPGALLERLVHLEIDPEDLPTTYQLLAVDIPDDTQFEIVDANDLPSEWRDRDATTRSAGDRWLQSGRTALLRVPSAVTPRTFNWLLNPKHPDAASATIAEVIVAPFDPRLFR